MFHIRLSVSTVRFILLIGASVNKAPQNLLPQVFQTALIQIKAQIRLLNFFFFSFFFPLSPVLLLQSSPIDLNDRFCECKLSLSYNSSDSYTVLYWTELLLSCLLSVMV